MHKKSLLIALFIAVAAQQPMQAMDRLQKVKELFTRNWITKTSTGVSLAGLAALAASRLAKNYQKPLQKFGATAALLGAAGLAAYYLTSHLTPKPILKTQIRWLMERKKIDWWFDSDIQNELRNLVRQYADVLRECLKLKEADAKKIALQSFRENNLGFIMELLAWIAKQNAAQYVNSDDAALFVAYALPFALAEYSTGDISGIKAFIDAAFPPSKITINIDGTLKTAFLWIPLNSVIPDRLNKGNWLFVMQAIEKANTLKNGTPLAEYIQHLEDEFEKLKNESHKKEVRPPDSPFNIRPQPAPLSKEAQKLAEAQLESRRRADRPGMELNPQSQIFYDNLFEVIVDPEKSFDAFKEKLTELETNGFDVNAPELYETQGAMSQTLLMRAIEVGKPDVAQYLLDLNVRVDTQDNFKKNALMYLAELDSPKYKKMQTISEDLLARMRPTDFSKKDRINRTAEEIARKNKNPKLANKIAQKEQEVTRKTLGDRFAEIGF